MGGLWDILLQNMSSIVSLGVHGFIEKRLFEVLSGETTPSCHTPLSFPLYPPVWGFVKPDDWETDDYRSDSSRADRRAGLLACLAHRSTQGLKLSNLRFNQEWRTGWDLGTLSGYVDTIQSADGQVVSPHDLLMDAENHNASVIPPSQELRLGSEELSFGGWYGLHFLRQKEYR
ncbi:hypothetical protein SISNIDRAFT_456689 [Sistotremastrum niveocremeum HHB9708]|uniref:Uncharacterized protein n=1 Tax=Sistotremastrum niveocremeum HHB9708 TaxID=1314777 RepID=A0A164SFH1_9AGAM|nr:hypothetical protein SISNIDRAFT_456689 [Sistotremastrum niveocremeum HHB9708]